MEPSASDKKPWIEVIEDGEAPASASLVRIILQRIEAHRRRALRQSITLWPEDASGKLPGAMKGVTPAIGRNRKLC